MARREKIGLVVSCPTTVLQQSSFAILDFGFRVPGLSSCPFRSLRVERNPCSSGSPPPYLTLPYLAPPAPAPLLPRFTLLSGSFLRRPSSRASEPASPPLPHLPRLAYSALPISSLYPYPLPGLSLATHKPPPGFRSRFSPTHSPSRVPPSPTPPSLSLSLSLSSPVLAFLLFLFRLFLSLCR